MSGGCDINTVIPDDPWCFTHERDPNLCVRELEAKLKKAKAALVGLKAMKKLVDFNRQEADRFQTRAEKAVAALAALKEDIRRSLPSPWYSMVMARAAGREGRRKG